jgi:signal transduction histidine kinase
VGLNFHDLQYPEPLASTLQAQIQEVIDLKAEVRAETEFRSAYGGGFYEYIFVPLFGKDGDVAGVAGTTRDITARKEAEIALRASERELEAERTKLRNLFEQAPAFICTLEGPEFVFGFANEEYFRLIGQRDILGRRLSEILPEVVGQGYYELLEDVFSTGRTFIGRGMGVVFNTEFGDQVQRYVDFIYQAVRDSSGTITSILVHGVDVTDQVLSRNEVERLNEELEARVEERTRQLQIANRDMEGFTYSVSHDLRAPLRAIVSSSRILLDEYADKLNESGRHELKRQVVSANKLANLIDELLKLSRVSRQELVKSSVDLSSIALSVARELVESERASNCNFEIEPGVTAVGDPTLLSLLLLNLLENACKFSPSGGVV